MVARASDAVRLAVRERLRVPFCRHRPTVKQAAFLLLNQLEVLYGGAAGGGKSDALLMAALRYVERPGYAAILFRRTLTDLSLPGSLLDRSHAWLAGSAARWNGRDSSWTFPSGATLSFGYLDRDADKHRYQGAEFQFIGFDELTQFSESQYSYLFSRLRRARAVNVPLRMRAASNPGGPGHDWVRQRFIVESNAERAFLPASIRDNPHLEYDSYVRNLGVLDAVTKAQLLHGDWNVNDAGLLNSDDIAACQAECLWPGGKPPILDVRAPRPELYLGVDVGRTRDLTVIWTFEKVGDVCWCREIVTMANATFRDQKDAIVARLTRNVVRSAIDKGGIGNQLAEELQAAYPVVVEPVNLSAGHQGNVAQRFAIAFAERKIRIPDDPILRADLRLVRKTKVVNGTNHVETLRGAVGHADRFWAGALAFDAAQGTEPKPKASLPLAYPRKPDFHGNSSRH